MVVFSERCIGSYGEVFVCYNRENGYARAVKILPKVAMNERERNRFLREISVMRIMDHPNIVRLHETFSDSKRYYIVTEYNYYIIIDFVQEGNCLNEYQKKNIFQNNMLMSHYRNYLKLSMREILQILWDWLYI